MVKALIIDGDADVRTLMSLLLQRFGCQARAARNGIEGQQVAIQDQPDLILLDVMMEELDGYQTCAGLRGAGYRGKILMISAIPEAEGHPRAMACGADGYLQKPVSPATLKQQVLALQPQAA